MLRLAFGQESTTSPGAGLLNKATFPFFKQNKKKNTLEKATNYQSYLVLTWWPVCNSVLFGERSEIGEEDAKDMHVRPGLCFLYPYNLFKIKK